MSSHPALVNAIVLVLHSVAGSVPAQQSAGSSRNVSSSSYSDMPGECRWWRLPDCSVWAGLSIALTTRVFPVSSAGGFLFEGMSDDEEDFQSVNLSNMTRILESVHTDSYLKSVVR